MTVFKRDRLCERAGSLGSCHEAHCCRIAIEINSYWRFATSLDNFFLSSLANFGLADFGAKGIRCEFRGAKFIASNYRFEDWLCCYHSASLPSNYGSRIARFRTRKCENAPGFSRIMISCDYDYVVRGLSAWRGFIKAFSDTQAETAVAFSD